MSLGKQTAQNESRDGLLRRRAGAPELPGGPSGPLMNLQLGGNEPWALLSHGGALKCAEYQAVSIYRTVLL